MAFSNSTRRVVTSIAGTLLIALSSSAFAAEPPAAAASTPSKEMREQMARLHEQMAACLRSDKPVADCRAEMQKNCHAMIGNQGCAMMSMGGGMMGHGMRRRMRSNTPPSSSPPK